MVAVSVVVAVNAVALICKLAQMDFLTIRDMVNSDYLRKPFSVATFA